MLTDCKLAYFLGYFLSQFSSAILVIMSVQKWYSLYFPLKAKTLCTVNLAKKTSLVTFIIFFIFNSQYFFIIEVQTIDGVQYCKFINEKYKVIYYRIDSILYSCGPAVVMCLVNSAIIYKLVRDRNKIHPLSNQSVHKAAKQVTLMLVTISITFIFLTIPVSIAFNLYDFPPPLLFVVSGLMSYLNHSINGFFYCIIGSKFRAELFKFMKCSKCHKVNPPAQIFVVGPGQ